jgi:hypothetical protein
MPGDSELEKQNQDSVQFVEHLERASQKVRTWPAWKQHVLGEVAPSHDVERSRSSDRATLGFCHGSEPEGSM